MGGPTGFASGPLTVYGSGDVDAATGRLDIVASPLETADLVILEPIEDGVFFEPRTLDGRPATNRVVTYLDLSAVRSSRYRAARDAVWADEGE